MLNQGNEAQNIKASSAIRMVYHHPQALRLGWCITILKKKKRKETQKTNSSGNVLGSFDLDDGTLDNDLSPVFEDGRHGLKKLGGLNRSLQRRSRQDNV